MSLLPYCPGSTSRHRIAPTKTPAGELYALDRRLPLAGAWLGLARFQGSHRTITRWITRSAAPRFRRLALGRWRAGAAAILNSHDPYFLCLARGDVREGLRLLVAEWMEFRRTAPSSRWRLVVRTCPSSLDQDAFEVVAPFWLQVRALKRQLGVRRGGIYLWLRAEDDAGDERLLDSAGALVLAARNQSFTDPVALALERGKPVLAPRGPGDVTLPDDYPYQFATRPAVLRFIGEPRRMDTASITWPVPEPLALAEAIGKAAADIEALTAAGLKAGRYWRSRAAARENRQLPWDGIPILSTGSESRPTDSR